METQKLNYNIVLLSSIF